MRTRTRPSQDLREIRLHHRPARRAALASMYQAAPVFALVTLVVAIGASACDARAQPADRAPARVAAPASPGSPAHHAAAPTRHDAPTAAQAARRAAFYAPSPDAPSAATLTALGRALFFDRGLSASGTLSCASCHDPRRGMAPDNDRPIQRGGDGRQLGFRAAPSLRYLATLAPFTEHYIDDEAGGADQGPTGGYMWDGRAASAHAQAELPLFAPFEMANRSPDEFAARLRRAPCADELRAAFGAGVLDRGDDAVKAVTRALEAFEQSPADFAPYSSKFDAVIRGRAKLSAQEARGFALFNAPDKGNCASCHPSTGQSGAFPVFSDFGFIALGVPRARGIPANADPAFHDLGLCGPLRKDLADRPEFCGLFRTPSLRNVALRRRLFHNGAFTSLTQAVRFYATRDTAPEQWYPRDARGRVRVFDDLPARYLGNINRDPPFGGKPGGKPAIDEAEIADIVAFLATLTDGYQP